MSSDGRRTTDAGTAVRAGSYPGLVNVTSSASEVFADLSAARDLTRAERVLVAVPVTDPGRGVGYAQGTRRRAKSLNRRLLGLATIDLAAATTAAALAFAINAGAAPWAMPTSEPSVLALPPALLVLIALNGGYDARHATGGHDDLVRVFRAYLHFAVLVAVTSYATHAYFARSFLLVAVPLALALDLAGRFAARKCLPGRYARGASVRTALAVGDARTVKAFTEAVAHDRTAGIVVRGTCLIDGCTADSGALDALAAPAMGDFASVVESARAIRAATIVVVSASQLGSDRLRWLAWQLEGTGIELLVSPNLEEVARRRLRIHSVAWMPLLHVEQPEFHGLRLLVKEVMDRLLSLLAVIMLLPLFVVIFVIVRVSTPGPAIFRQTRVGRGGKAFQMLKFRSMYVDAEARLAELQSENVHTVGPLFKLHSDPRVTRVGRILRRYSLDELPQLVNVVAGHMSLVGPRPPLPSEVQEYETDTHRRLLVKPGITGLWQVSGRSDLDWAESVRLDLRYVENWSPALDLVILWKTASAVLRGSGAY